MKKFLFTILFVTAASAAFADSLTVALPEVRARRLTGTIQRDGLLT